MFRHTSALTSPNQCSTFSFPSAGFQEASLQMGSLVVPSTLAIRSIEDAYNTMLKTNNMLGNPDAGSQIPLKEYCADITRTGAVSGDDKIIATSKFLLAFSLEQVLQAEHTMLQGLNTLQNNSQISLRCSLIGQQQPLGGSETADTAC